MREAHGLIRVLIADDSDVTADALELLLEEDPGICVVGRALNGNELLDAARLRGAQVIILDLLMPQVGGLSVLQALAHQQPVIVVSSMDGDARVASEALALGAYAFFSKRQLSTPTQAQKLRDAVKQAASQLWHSTALTKLVFVVGSTGAVPHLERLATELQPYDVSLLVVQHLPPTKEGLLVDLLRARGAHAVVATDGAVVERGVIIAPTDRHLSIDTGRRLRLHGTRPVNGHLPSGEVLLLSALTLSGPCAAVMLSGLGDDGAVAMGELARRGVPCLALAPQDCQGEFMPAAALNASKLVRAVRGAQLATTVREILNLG